MVRSLATYAPAPLKNYPSITPPYPHLLSQLALVRKILNRPLSLAEKIVYSHLDNVEEGLAGGGKIRGENYLKLRPDRVAMQDASAQMALLQFSTCDRPTTAVPTSIHCDHLISAFSGAEADLKRAIASNKEVFDFLESAARKYGIEFWGPGSGIIHQIVLENYSAPGLLMLGTDSHTPNAGGLGAIAIGVGGADAVDAMTYTPWELKAPKLIGVELKGKLSGWLSAKDVVLEVVGRLTVRGGTGHIIEYFGEGVQSQSATGLATICNMGAEMGATTSVFPYTDSMRAYLQATNRGPVASAADAAHAAGFLSADPGAEYDQHIVIDLSTLEPRLNGPFTPDFSTPLSKFGALVKEKGWKDEIAASLIGSCTNSSYEDMSRVASIARQATAHGLKTATSFMITPGSELINATIERDGLTADLEAVGGVVLANACGPCIGQWDRKECKGEENAILTSFNRNFKARNDGNRQTMNFLASPDIVTAMAFSGKLSFDPTKDELIGADGKPFRFDPPVGDELPLTGFTNGDTAYLPTPLPTPVPETELAISPTSTRLELLAPFDPHFTAEEFASTTPLEFDGLRCLIRIRGKCTTDEISAAGAWLKYKGHLSNLSENTLIGATNDENGKVNSAAVPGEAEGTIPEVAKRWKAAKQPWMIVTDHNYGEGSAREHASLQPRFLNCKLILARSFARIHRTNLTKQGVLPLTFINDADYSLISAGDEVSTSGLDALLRGDLSSEVTVIVKRPDGSVVEIATEHALSKDQVEWISAGSALNVIKAKAAAEKTFSNHQSLIKLPPRRKVVKKGLQFTVAVCGQSGTGRTTFVNTLCESEVLSHKDLAEPARAHEEDGIKIKPFSVELEEEGVRISLTIVDTPGFGDQIDNEFTFSEIVGYLERQYDDILAEESRIKRNPRFRDNRVHALLYFITPTGHALRELDIELMRRLSPRVNVIPVIGKADSLTPSELSAFKKRVMEDIEHYNIPVYNFPYDHEEDDEETIADNSELRALLPFAIVGSEEEIEVGGELVRARRYPWGIVEVDNPKHSDFGRLRSALLNTHLTDLKEITHDFLYENYRTEKLSRTVNNQDGGYQADTSILPEDLATQSVRLKEEQLRREEEKLREVELKSQREISEKRQELIAKEESLLLLESRLQQAREQAGAYNNGGGNQNGI